MALSTTAQGHSTMRTSYFRRKQCTTFLNGKRLRMRDGRLKTNSNCWRSNSSTTLGCVLALTWLTTAASCRFVGPSSGSLSAVLPDSTPDEHEIEEVCDLHKIYLRGYKLGYSHGEAGMVGLPPSFFFEQMEAEELSAFNKGYFNGNRAGVAEWVERSEGELVPGEIQ